MTETILESSGPAGPHRLCSWTGERSPAVAMSDVSVQDVARTSFGLGELDRVRGGGIVPGPVSAPPKPLVQRDTPAALLDMATHVRAHPPKEPFLERRSTGVYLQPRLRFRIVEECSRDYGSSLWRAVELGDQGVSHADADSRAFAENLFAALADQLSRCDLEHLAAVFQEQAQADAERAGLSLSKPGAGRDAPHNPTSK
jgi:hypothetical protein